MASYKTSKAISDFELSLRKNTELNGLDIAYSQYDLQCTEIDIDPENNFFTRSVNDCQYYTEDDYNCTFKDVNTFSVIHFNSRSLYANFDHIKSYLKQFSKFSVILITETWIRNDKEMDFSIEGYEFIGQNRRNKQGGGVAMFVDLNYGFKIIENMTMVVDDILECLTIEIVRTKKKNIIVSCIYRTPGSNIDVFNNWLEEHFSNLNQKLMFVGGDLNIDLLNPNKHKKTNLLILYLV